MEAVPKKKTTKTQLCYTIVTKEIVFLLYFLKALQKYKWNGVFVVFFNIPGCLPSFFLCTLHIFNHNNHQTPPRPTWPKHHITTFHHVKVDIHPPSHRHTNNIIMQPKQHPTPIDIRVTSPLCCCANTTPSCNKEDTSAIQTKVEVARVGNHWCCGLTVVQIWGWCGGDGLGCGQGKEGGRAERGKRIFSKVCRYQ